MSNTPETPSVIDILKDNNKTSQEKLEALKAEIEKEWTKKLNLELIKSAIENLPNWDEKYFILGAILSWLNKLWIGIKSIKNGKVELILWRQNIQKNLDRATFEETVSYETFINSQINMWKIGIEDIIKAQMYRTWTIDQYINEVSWAENTSVSGYVARLLEKHKIKVWEGDISDIDKFNNEEEYNHLINTLNVMIKDSQAEKEFLLNYFEYIKINWNKPLKEWDVKTYKETSDKVENNILNELEKLTPEQKWILWIGSSDEAAQKAADWKNNPIDAVLDTFSQWGGALWLILGIIWAIFFGKKWALTWFIWGMWIVWWAPFAWDIISWATDLWSRAIESIWKPTYEWLKSKFWNWVSVIQETYEKAAFWYDFREVQFNDWTWNKDLMGSNFVKLFEKVKDNIWDFRKENWTALSDAEKASLQAKMNEYMEVLKEKYPDKTPNQIKEMFKDKTLAEILIELYNTPSSSVQNPSQIPTQNQNPTTTPTQPDSSKKIPKFEGV